MGPRWAKKRLKMAQDGDKAKPRRAILAIVNCIFARIYCDRCLRALMGLRLPSQQVGDSYPFFMAFLRRVPIPSLRLSQGFLSFFKAFLRDSYPF